MPLIKWDESFSVQNAEIDEQHRKWIEIINKMHDSMLNDDYNSFTEQFEKSINEMVDYTGYHLAFEEKYLLNIHYPGLDEHARKHEEFTEKLAKAVRSLRSGDMLRFSKFLKMARHWLVEHIMIEDKEYSLYAARKIES